MIAKEISAPRTGGSFQGLVTYLTSSRGKEERVGRVQATNCQSDEDVAAAVIEVRNTQARNGRARQTTYHLMLSFREEPPAEVLGAIEERACAALGFGHHQRVSVVHHDTDHLHLHVAINRVCPKTHRAHSPSFSKFALDRLCVELERDYGLQPDHHRTLAEEDRLQATDELRTLAQTECLQALCGAESWAEVHEAAEAKGLHLQLRGNGLVLVSQAGVTVRASTVSRELGKATLEKRLGAFEVSPSSPPAAAAASRQRERPRPVEQQPRVPDMERVAGVESLIGWMQRQCAEDLRKAQSWRQLHVIAQKHGLSAQLRGNGLVFVAAEGTAVKGSSVLRELSRSALERRLGAFEAAGATQNAMRWQYNKRPLLGWNEGRLYERYQQERAVALARRSQAVAELRERRTQVDEKVRRSSQRRWSAIKLVAKGRVGWMLWSAYAKQADQRDRELARRQHRAAVRDAAAKLPSTGWLEWLRQRAGQGDEEALLWLRKRSRDERAAASAVLGGGPSQKLLVAAPADSVTATGTVIYRVPGGSIRDAGKRLHLMEAAQSDVAAEALLRLAHARYGSRIGVDGDEKFRERVVRAAVSSKLPITFADEQLEKRRLEHQRKERADERQGTQRPRQHVEAAGGVTRTGREPVGGQRRATSRVRKPYAGLHRGQAAPNAGASLRSVSELDVVRLGRAREVLLPRDARGDVEQRGAGADSVVRRDSAVRIDPEPPKRGRGRRA